MFFARRAAAILAPSPWGNAVTIACLILDEKARTAPASVPSEATAKEPSSAPQRPRASPRRLVPNSSRGVASVSVVPWRKALAGDPPDGNSVLRLPGNQPTLERTKVRAIATTGAPSNFPGAVDLPNTWASEAASDRTATLPQLSAGEITDAVGDGTAASAVPNKEAYSAGGRRVMGQWRRIGRSSGTVTLANAVMVARWPSAGTEERIAATVATRRATMFITDFDFDIILF